MKYALITGGSRGIGRSVSIKLAAMGYTVLINYQSNDKEAANTLQLVREKRGDGELLKFDVTDPKAVSEALNNWSEQHPDEYIEVLINNAGIRKDNLMLWMTEAEWSGVLNTSLNGFFYVTQALLKNMLVKRFGRIVNIVSLSGIKGMPGQTNYSGHSHEDALRRAGRERHPRQCGGARIHPHGNDRRYQRERMEKTDPSRTLRRTGRSGWSRKFFSLSQCLLYYR